MKKSVVINFAWPLVLLGVLLAITCLASTWYINRLQADLARAVRNDAARLQVAEELQIALRHLRFHSTVFAADPSPSRRAEATADLHQVGTILSTAKSKFVGEDLLLLEEIERSYQHYVAGLNVTGAVEPGVRSLGELVRWSDERRVSGLLAPCRELADRQQLRMAENLEQSETQTLLAGRMLVGLGLAGALGGLLSGYATARRLSQRTSRLLVRVQAVQAHLNQDVGAMTVEAPRHVGELDTELDLIVSRVKDVCQRLQGQERELLRAEQLAAVGQLAAGVAHEIRNPLTGIKILVEAALRPTGPSDLTPTDLGLIRDEILRLERTVQGLLDFARTPPLNPQRLDIGVLVVESVEILQRRAEAKSVVIHTESSATPILAEVDRDQFLSLLTNLLLNAIEAVPFGGVVTVNSSETPSGMIQVVVADDGPGIAPSVIDKLFTPFATTKSSGTGLGLAIAMRVAKDHGGELAAENRIEGGARFTLKLPVARS